MTVRGMGNGAPFTLTGPSFQCAVRVSILLPYSFLAGGWVLVLLVCDMVCEGGMCDNALLLCCVTRW